jgi:hypothetical protein
MADSQKRRAELLNEIKRKDRHTKHFVKDKQEAANLVRIYSHYFLIDLVFEY